MAYGKVINIECLNRTMPECESIEYRNSTSYWNERLSFRFELFSITFNDISLHQLINFQNFDHSLLSAFISVIVKRTGYRAITTIVLSAISYRNIIYDIELRSCLVSRKTSCISN